MTSNPVISIKRRTIAFSLILAVALVTVDFFISRSIKEERKAQIVLELIKSDGILSGELNRLFNGLEDDFRFLEVQIKDILKRKDSRDGINTLINFLDSHPDYFKVRLTSVTGREIFKLVQKSDHAHYEESKMYFDLSGQPFFEDLKAVGHEDFFFSPMEANVINGVIEKPIRSTIRVSRRLNLNSGQEAVLIINIDGKRILNLFNEHSILPSLKEKILLDHQSNYVASLPFLSEATYAVDKLKIQKDIFNRLVNNQENHGSFEMPYGVAVFTKIPLPRSRESWYLLSTTSESTLEDMIYKEKLTIYFWECLVFIIMVSWFWRDENKRHKEQVVKVLLSERSEFIQNVSHQLKTPLTIIYNELSMDSIPTTSKVEIKKEISFLIKVVEDLLLLSQIDALKKIPLKEENVLEILNESFDLVAQKAKRKQVSLKVNVPNDLTDNIEQFNRLLFPELLKSAFFNILDNAVEYSPEHGTVHILMSIEKERIVISIKDSGPGIPEDLIPHIFQRFSRDSTAPRKGSGLGLAIAKKIIELNGGKISLHSNEGGACFRVIL